MLSTKASTWHPTLAPEPFLSLTQGLPTSLWMKSTSWHLFALHVMAIWKDGNMSSHIWERVFFFFPLMLGERVKKDWLIAGCVEFCQARKLRKASPEVIFLFLWLLGRWSLANQSEPNSLAVNLSQNQLLWARAPIVAKAVANRPETF